VVLKMKKRLITNTGLFVVTLIIEILWHQNRLVSESNKLEPPELYHEIENKIEPPKSSATVPAHLEWNKTWGNNWKE